MKPEQSTDKHTPGPWRYDVQNHQIRTGEPTERRFSGELISTVSPLNPEMLANGALIAAAPEMLSALKAIAALKRHDANQGEQPNPRYLTLNVKAILIADIEAAIQAASPAHQKEEAHG